MANYKRDIVDINLETGNIHRSFMNKMIGEGDADAIIFGARVWHNGEAANITGSQVTGYFIRADGVTEVIDGGLATGNLAEITVPAACCAVEGNFTLAIKITGGGVTGTIRIIDGTVVNTVDGALTDPGSVIPSLEDLMAIIDQAEAAAEEIADYSVRAELLENENYAIVVMTEEA